MKTEDEDDRRGWPESETPLPNNKPTEGFATYQQPKETETAEFAKLKYQVGQILVQKFLEWNDGKFHTALELNPATHALTEFMQAYADQQCNNYKDQLRKEINHLLVTTGSTQYLKVIHLLESLKLKQP